MRVFLLILTIFSAVFAASDERFGRLRVDTDPPGADVVIIAELGKTPLANDFMNPGLYRLEIRHPKLNYQPVAEEVTFADGQTVTLSHKLERPPLMTGRKWWQLAMGTAAAAGFVWAVADEDKSRRAAAVAGGGIIQAALIVTIIVWR